MIERLEKNNTGADKENSGARLFAKIDQEERLQAALKDSEGEARALRKHLLTLMHHVHTSLGQADLGESFAVNALPQVCPGLLIAFQHYRIISRVCAASASKLFFAVMPHVFAGSV